MKSREIRTVNENEIRIQIRIPVRKEIRIQIRIPVRNEIRIQSPPKISHKICYIDRIFDMLYF